VIKSKRVRWAEHVAYMAKMRNTYKILVENPEGQRPLRKLRRDPVGTGDIFSGGKAAEA